MKPSPDVERSWWVYVSAIRRSRAILLSIAILSRAAALLLRLRSRIGLDHGI